jgi:hypothetical protein
MKSRLVEDGIHGWRRHGIGSGKIFFVNVLDLRLPANCYESGRMEDLVKITVTPATRSSLALMSETISITPLVYSHTSIQLLSRVSVS